jgi:phage terminase large subunit-like protein
MQLGRRPVEGRPEPHAIIFDELHRQPDTSLWDIFEHADSAREQPLWINITTAGEDETGVWYEQREYSEKVNAGDIPDITHLGVVYRADPDDDIEDPATWLKANPSLGPP